MNLRKPAIHATTRKIATAACVLALTLAAASSAHADAFPPLDGNQPPPGINENGQGDLGVPPAPAPEPAESVAPSDPVAPALFAIKSAKTRATHGRLRIAIMVSCAGNAKATATTSRPNAARVTKLGSVNVVCANGVATLRLALNKSQTRIARKASLAIVNLTILSQGDKLHLATTVKTGGKAAKPKAGTSASGDRYWNSGQSNCNEYSNSNLMGHMVSTTPPYFRSSNGGYQRTYHRVIFLAWTAAAGSAWIYGPGSGYYWTTPTGPLSPGTSALWQTLKSGTNIYVRPALQMWQQRANGSWNYDWAYMKVDFSRNPSNYAQTWCHFA